MATKKTNHEDTQQASKKNLHRSETNKVIAGVAGGIGEYFNIDSTLVRLIFILLTVFGGSGILIYLILWIIMPGPKDSAQSPDNVIKQNLSDISDKARSFAHDIHINTGTNKNDSKFWWGLFIIIFGIFILFQNLGIFDIFNFEKFWPIIIILIGVFVLLRKK